MKLMICMVIDFSFCFVFQFHFLFRVAKCTHKKLFSFTKECFLNKLSLHGSFCIWQKQKKILMILTIFHSNIKPAILVLYKEYGISMLNRNDIMWSIANLVNWHHHSFREDSFRF